MLAGVPLGAWLVACITAVPAVLGQIQPPPEKGKTTDQPPCAELVAVLEEATTVVGQLADSVAGNTSELEDLRGAVDLAAVHRRVNDAELALLGFKASCGIEPCLSSGEQGKCDEPDTAVVQDAAFDTIGPCVRREKVGHIAFHPGLIEYSVDQQAELSRIAGRIEGELRYVFAVGYADGPSFSWENYRLGLKRARAVATTLLEELGSDVAGRPRHDHIRAVSGVDWAPTTLYSPSQHGTVDVYLLWHGISPFCKFGDDVAMGIK